MVGSLQMACLSPWSREDTAHKIMWAFIFGQCRSSKFQPHLAVLGEQNTPCLKMGAILTTNLNFHYYSGVTFRSLQMLGVSFQSIRNSGKQLGQCTWPVTEPTMPPSRLVVRCKHNLLLRMSFRLQIARMFRPYY